MDARTFTQEQCFIEPATGGVVRSGGLACSEEDISEKQSFVLGKDNRN
jgi:hypothetical protein